MNKTYLKAGFAIIMAALVSCTDSKETTELELTNYQSYGGHDYAITSQRYTWNEAKQFAEEQGGYLVIIESQEENNFIRDTYRVSLDQDQDILWIGLSDAEEEGVFKWVNGETPTFTNWAIGEPNNDYNTQDYGHMYIDGTWDDVEDKECFAVVEFDN